MKKFSYHIITIGCQMNKSDSERIAGFLNGLGYVETADRNKAGLVIFTTCGVRQSAEDRIYGLVPRLKEANPKARIVLTGCLAYRQDVKKRLEQWVDVFATINQVFELKSWLKSQSCLKKSKRPILTTPQVVNCEYLKNEPAYESRFSALVPIGNGCDNFCAYCVVPYARGRETYRSSKEILNEIKGLLVQKYKEIHLSAQNVNSYRDPGNKKIDFPKLLKMVNDLPGDFWIRFSSCHPKDMSSALIKTIAGSDKVCRHVHLPVQSGDNAVLKAMNRKYTVKHYKNLITKIRAKMNRPGIFPPVAITTDIIVGFPGETRAQFNNSAKLFKEIKYDLAYISQFSPRAGTVADKMVDDVSKEEKKRREEILNDILSQTALAHHKKYVGKTVRVLVEGKNNRGEWYGKTETYKVIKFKCPSEADLTGEFINVKIIKAKDFGLEGHNNPELLF